MQWTVTSTAAPPPGFRTLSAVSSQTRASRPSAPRLRGVLHAAAVQDLPLQGSTRRNRVSLPGPLAPSSFGLAPRWVRTRRALISLAFARHPRPSGPPSPRRQDCSRATSCAADLGAVAGRGPGLERRFTRVETPVSSSPAGTSNRAHPRDAPSTSERSSSRVPDALPRSCDRLVGRDLRGVLSLQSFVPAAGLWP